MSKSTKTIIIGDGGHTHSILAIDSNINIDGYSAPNQNPSMRIEYMGDDEMLLKAKHKLIIGLSYIGRKVTLDLRKRVIEKFSGFEFQTIIAASAVVKTNKIGQGTIIFEKAIVNYGTAIGENCVINTGAIVEHDCKIGNNVQISPGAIILGGVEIGDNTFVGAGAIVRDSVKVGANKIIPMGQRVIQDE